MVSNGVLDLDYLVQPDRVHRSCYTDADIFARELEGLFEHTWIYVGHESQVKQPGDYATTQIGRQPVMMVRDRSGAICVLYNRCPHRGTMLCNELMGNAGQTFTCSYHAWQFNLDGSVFAIPAKQGYDSTRFCMEAPDASMKPAAQVDSYRGFVFAKLTEGGPDLLTFLGGARMAFGVTMASETIASATPVSLETQREVEQFLYRQAEILDERRWDDWLGLFTPEGHYWMPADPLHTSGEGVPSIFYEDHYMMRGRAEALTEGIKATLQHLKTAIEGT